MQKSLVGIIAAAGLSAGAHGQTSPWYLTQGTSGPGATFVMQGGSQINAFKWAYAGGGEMPIVVTPSYIRQASGQPGGGAEGGEYKLDGTPTGLANYWSSPEKGVTAYDSATDGKNNFVIDWSSGVLNSYDTNFGGGSFMFKVRDSDLGITYDSATGTIWTSNWSDGLISQWDLGGTMLNQFGIGASSSVGGLAYDAKDDTFWAADNSNGVGWQFDRKGNVLDKIGLPGYVLGGEMESQVPAPGAMALLGLGGLAAARRRR